MPGLLCCRLENNARFLGQTARPKTAKKITGFEKQERIVAIYIFGITYYKVVCCFL